MRRPPRNAPLWIVLGAATVVSAASFSTRAGSQGTAEPPSGDAAATETAEPAAPDNERSPLEPTRRESRRTAPADDAFAAPLPASPAPNTAAPFPELTGASGMVVGIDPETGKLGMPSKQFRDALRESRADAALSRSMEGLQVIQRPDGSRMIDLQDRFQDYAVVRITPDGRKEQACVQGQDVEAALRGEAAVSPAEPEAVEPSAVAPEPASDSESDSAATEVSSPEASPETAAPEPDADHDANSASAPRER